MSWNLNSDLIRQLKNWIDPNLLVGNTHTGLRILRNITYDNNDITIEVEKIKLQNISITNGSSVIINFEEFIIIDKDFYVSSGSTLDLHNLVY